MATPPFCPLSLRWFFFYISTRFTLMESCCIHLGSFWCVFRFASMLAVQIVEHQFQVQAVLTVCGQTTFAKQPLNSPKGLCALVAQTLLTYRIWICAFLSPVILGVADLYQSQQEKQHLPSHPCEHMADHQ